MAYITYIQGEPFSIQFTFYIKYSRGKNCRGSPKLQPGKQAGSQSIGNLAATLRVSMHVKHIATLQSLLPQLQLLVLALAVAVACVSCVCMCVYRPKQRLGGLVSVSYVIIK